MSFVPRVHMAGLAQPSPRLHVPPSRRRHVTKLEHGLFDGGVTPRPTWVVRPQRQKASRDACIPAAAPYCFS
eukprot:5282877-Pyramimonas_sp.AAC.1